MKVARKTEEIFPSTPGASSIAKSKAQQKEHGTKRLTGSAAGRGGLAAFIKDTHQDPAKTRRLKALSGKAR